MKNIILNLISEQTIPVFQFIKEFKNINKIVFITTKEMEEKKKTTSLIKALNINNEMVEIIEVNPESLKDVESKLEDYYKEKINDEDKIFINITTGTKLMAMATYKVFSKYENVKIFYIPLNSKILKQIYPEKKHNDKELSYNIKLDEYLTVYGIEIINKKEPIYEYSIVEKFFKMYIENELTNVINKLRELRNSDKKTKKSLKKKGIEVREIENLDKILLKLGINKSIIDYYDIEFFTGGWFEEFVYYNTKNILNLEDDFIGLNYSISRIYGKNVKNEFDILAIYENSPIIIECKTSNYDSLTKRNFLQETIYKLSSLKKDFGLSAKAYIFTLDTNIKKSDIERALITGIELVDRNKIINKTFSLTTK